MEVTLASDTARAAFNKPASASTVELEPTAASIAGETIESTGAARAVKAARRGKRRTLTLTRTMSEVKWDCIDEPPFHIRSYTR